MKLPDMETIDEQLTAYLDGELPPEEATSLELSLVDDERLRLRLAELRQAYELLDDLPETPHNQRFTKSTLELVIKDLSTSKPRPAEIEVVRKMASTDWWEWPRVIALIGAFVFLGALTAFAVNFENARRELRDLGLIAGIRGLEDANELDTAIRLSKETEVIAVLRENMGDRLVPPPPNSMGQRKLWVQSLTPMQISRLESHRDRKNMLDLNTRTRLAAIESQIEILPDHKTIQETVHLLGLVLDSVGSSKRLDMESKNPEERYTFLKEQLCIKAATYYAGQMPSSDRTALEQWDEKFFRPALIEELQPNRLMETRELMGQLLWRRFGQREQRELELDNQEELIKKLTETLSPTGGKLLTGIETKSQQLWILNIWLYPDRVTTTALLDSYDKLNRDYRDRLDLEDPQQAKRALERAAGGPGFRGPRRP